jgi:hypothetical protein
MGKPSLILAMTSSAATTDGDSPKAALGATKNKTSPKIMRVDDIFTGHLLSDYSGMKMAPRSEPFLSSPVRGSRGFFEPKRILQTASILFCYLDAEWLISAGNAIDVTDMEEPILFD